MAFNLSRTKQLNTSVSVWVYSSNPVLWLIFQYNPGIYVSIYMGTDYATAHGY